MATWLFDMLHEYIIRAHSLSKKEKNKVNEIVSNALLFTKTHITRNRKSGIDEPSQIISLIWQEASFNLTKFGDQNLKYFADTLAEKSKYWTCPTKYQEEELNELGIKLVQVEKKLKEFIV